MYKLGGSMAIVFILGTLSDIVIGSSLGGDLTALPRTAVDWFVMFRINPWLGLYNLDLLTVANQLILVPVYFALYAAQRKEKRAFAGLALIVFLMGTTVLVAANAALPMLELSDKYAIAASEAQQASLASAGESLLAVGSHGSPGVFIGFALPTLAGILMSWVMLSGKVFGRATAIAGLIGNSWMLLYIVLVTFVPAIKSMAVTIAMPGGLLVLAWIVMFSLRLFRLGNTANA